MCVFLIEVINYGNAKWVESGWCLPKAKSHFPRANVHFLWKHITLRRHQMDRNAFHHFHISLSLSALFLKSFALSSIVSVIRLIPKEPIELRAYTHKLTQISKIIIKPDTHGGSGGQSGQRGKPGDHRSGSLCPLPNHSHSQEKRKTHPKPQLHTRNA